MKSKQQVYFGTLLHRFVAGADTWSSLEGRMAGMISCNATELKACFIGCTRTHRLHGTRLTSSRQVYVDFLVKSEWSSEFMNEL